MAVMAVAHARVHLIKTERDAAFQLEVHLGFVTEGAFNLSVHEHNNHITGTFYTNIAEFVHSNALSGLEFFPFATGSFAPGIDNGSLFDLDHPGKAVAINAGRGNRVGRIIFDRHIGIDRKVFVLECGIDFDRSTV